MKEWINNTTIKTDKIICGRCAIIKLVGYDEWE